MSPHHPLTETPPLAAIQTQDKLEDEDPEKLKTPRRIIHFVSGETMEEYSTEEEEEEEPRESERVDTSKLSWGPYLQFWALRIATTSLFTCDFLGGKLATLFGLNVPKYQYAIDEYNRRQDQDSEDEDGQVVADSQMSQSLKEKQHLETQNREYGSIPLTDRTGLSLTSTVSNIDETTAHDIENQTLSSTDVK